LLEKNTLNSKNIENLTFLLVPISKPIFQLNLQKMEKEKITNNSKYFQKSLFNNLKIQKEFEIFLNKNKNYYNKKVEELKKSEKGYEEINPEYQFNTFMKNEVEQIQKRFKNKDILVLGEGNTGKSSFINCLINEKIMITPPYENQIPHLQILNGEYEQNVEISEVLDFNEGEREIIKKGKEKKMKSKYEEANKDEKSKYNQLKKVNFFRKNEFLEYYRVIESTGT
jgi:hypothetical protein